MAKVDSKLDKLSKQVKELIEDSTFTSEYGELFFNVMTNELNTLTDKRCKHKTKHLMSDIVAIVFFALIAGVDEWAAIEDFAQDEIETLKKYLHLPNGIPSHDTIQRVFSIVNEEELQNTLVSILKEIIVKAIKDKDKPLYSNEELGICIEDIVAIDGKETRGTGRSTSDDELEKRNLNNLNVLSTEYGITLSSTRINEKSNEIPEAQRVIAKLDLKGCIVTADALNTQKETASQIINSKGDYCLALKNNHRCIYKEIAEYFEQDTLKDLKTKNNCYKKEVEETNLKRVTREYYISDDIKCFEDRDKWSKMKSIGYEKKTIKNLKTNDSEIEVRYFICSIPADVNLLSLTIARHWHVENLLHWVLDVSFRQDQLRTKDKVAMNNLGHIQRFVISILKILKNYYGKSYKRIRSHIGRKFNEEIPIIFSALKILYENGKL